MKVGVTTPVYNIPDIIQDRFKEYLFKSVQDADFEVDVHLTTIDDCNDNLFNRSKFLNSGIKELINRGCDFIICTDIDMIIPPGMIQYCVNKAKYNKNIFSFARFVDENMFNPFQYNLDIFLRLFPAHTTGYGGWNAMSSDLWIKSGGWPEELYGWGHEDIVFHYKLLHRNIDNIYLTSFPLLHINHDTRNKQQESSYRNNILISNNVNIYSTNWL